MTPRLLLTFPVALCALACNPNHFSGTVAGVSLSVTDAAFALTTDGAGKPTGMVLRMSDQPNVCGDAKANRRVKGATELTMVMLKKNPDGVGIAPDVGDYTVYPSIFTLTKNSVATASFEKLDTGCNNTVGSKGTGQSGLVTVSSFSIQVDGHASGTFDITFGDQADKNTGGFSAVFCDLAGLPVAPNCE